LNPDLVEGTTLLLQEGGYRAAARGKLQLLGILNGLSEALRVGPWHMSSHGEERYARVTKVTIDVVGQ
jgi:hypothetical protein